MPCYSNCDSCDPIDRRICLECRLGFHAVSTPDGGDETICEACPENCRKCSANGTRWCDECSLGYGFRGEGGPCQKCDDHLAGCLKCTWDEFEQTKCHGCRDGLGLSPTGECVACGQNCHQCDSGGLCDVCNTAFALGVPTQEEGHDTPKGNGQEDRCLSCADNCHDCRLAGPRLCDVCDSGYQLDNNTRTCR